MTCLRLLSLVSTELLKQMATAEKCGLVKGPKYRLENPVALLVVSPSFELKPTLPVHCRTFWTRVLSCSSTTTGWVSGAEFESFKNAWHDSGSNIKF